MLHPTHCFQQEILEELSSTALVIYVTYQRSPMCLDDYNNVYVYTILSGLKHVIVYCNYVIIFLKRLFIYFENIHN